MPIGHIPVAKDATPVFIAGAPRSGTTLLTAAMNTHPQVMITNELRPFSFLNDIRRRTEQPTELLPRHQLRNSYRRKMLKWNTRFILNFYRTQVSKDALGCPAEAGASVERGIKAFGDKNPGYADTHSPDCLDFIADQVPNAQFVHIHRDPRSCIASYLIVPVYSNELDRCIDVWTRHTQSMIKLRETLGPNRVMEIRYEDFVTSKGDKIFRALERHIGVDAASEPIDFLRRERNSPNPYRAPTTPTEQLGHTTYESRLTSEQLKHINEKCADLIDHFGYRRN